MKKRRIIKFLALIIILSLSMTVLVGCGQEANKKTESNEEVEDTDLEAKEDGETKDVIKVATSGAYYPYTYMKDDELVGFDIDIWEEIGKRLGKEIKWEITSFDGMFGMLDAGQVDSAAHQISITPEREKKYIFSEIYAYNPYKLYVHKDRDDINSLEDLYGKKFVCSATSNDREFIEKFDKDNKIEVIISSGVDAADVDLGRADAASGAVPNFESRMKEGGYNLKMVGDVIFEEENAYPFLNNEKGSELKKEVDKIIKEMHEDGTLTEMSLELFDMDITKPNVEK